MILENHCLILHCDTKGCKTPGVTFQTGMACDSYECAEHAGWDFSRGRDMVFCPYCKVIKGAVMSPPAPSNPPKPTKAMKRKVKQGGQNS